MYYPILMKDIRSRRELIQSYFLKLLQESKFSWAALSLKHRIFPYWLTLEGGSGGLRVILCLGFPLNASS